MEKEQTMKFEIRVDDKREDAVSEGAENTSLQVYSGEVSIDIGQVLAANQALLKNVNRRLEEMETRLRSLEGVIERQAQALQTAIPQYLMLAAPPREVKPWRPAAPPLDDAYFAKFSLFERWFQPYKMRRRAAEV
ncbi:MAG: hypothetical protein OZSIB_4313 [Candidatus Ozemobacter sibiricus]|uniref:Uncharacterized protein n=1 Tax=Candidatus Ozemobacter sibiricus TaxID=2268124 RepID=A0A367ZP81_9BACT|nr:MAG: hypothetical protein OZSIB_4313 [Candidatus Ozemobacter sibiricus]